jgi:hypothetical protein
MIEDFSAVLAGEIVSRAGRQQMPLALKVAMIIRTDL